MDVINALMTRRGYKVLIMFTMFHYMSIFNDMTIFNDVDGDGWVWIISIGYLWVG